VITTPKTVRKEESTTTAVKILLWFVVSIVCCKVILPTKMAKNTKNQSWEEEVEALELEASDLRIIWSKTTCQRMSARVKVVATTFTTKGLLKNRDRKWIHRKIQKGVVEADFEKIQIKINNLRLSHSSLDDRREAGVTTSSGRTTTKKIKKVAELMLKQNKPRGRKKKGLSLKTHHRTHKDCKEDWGVELEDNLGKLQKIKDGNWNNILP
jgi:hypothetical protein